MGVPTTQTKPKQQKTLLREPALLVFPSITTAYLLVCLNIADTPKIVIIHGELMITLSTVGSW